MVPAAILLTVCCGASAQPSGIRAPLTGFVTDAAMHAIRAIQGLPGSSVLGDPIRVGVSVESAWFSPAAGLALATDGTQLYLIRGLNGDTPVAATVVGSIPAVSLVAFNEGGTSAVVWSQAAGQIQWIGGLPDEPAAQAPITIASLPGPISALALDVQAQWALAASSDGNSGGIFQIPSQGGATPQLIVAAYKPCSVVLVNRDHDLVFADAAAGQLILVQDIYGSRTASVLASATDGVQNPVALRFGHGMLLVVSAGPTDGSQPANLMQYDLTAGRIVAQQPLPVSPTRLDQLSLRGVFLINDAGPGPLYLFSTVDALLTFVPPAAQ
jgi:hypothetical protein